MGNNIRDLCSAEFSLVNLPAFTFQPLRRLFPQPTPPFPLILTVIVFIFMYMCTILFLSFMPQHWWLEALCLGFFCTTPVNAISLEGCAVVTSNLPQISTQA